MKKFLLNERETKEVLASLLPEADTYYNERRGFSIDSEAGKNDVGEDENPEEFREEVLNSPFFKYDIELDVFNHWEKAVLTVDGTTKTFYPMGRDRKMFRDMVFANW